jgi:hypothetical protein
MVRHLPELLLKYILVLRKRPIEEGNNGVAAGELLAAHQPQVILLKLLAVIRNRAFRTFRSRGQQFSSQRHVLQLKIDQKVMKSLPRNIN